jgi:hypothetical protein
MMSARFIPLVKKYAIIIFMFMFLHVLLIFALPFLIALVDPSTVRLQTILSWTPTYLLNIVMAIFVYADMRRSRNVSVSIILATVAVGEIGAALFLLTELYNMFRAREPVA